MKNNRNKRSLWVLGAGLLLASLCHTGQTFAQETQKHTVQSGETLSKIATNYGTTVGDIMRFNGMDSNSKLEVGQTIKIPPAGVHIIGKATASTPSQPQSSNPNAGKTHVVKSGESLYKVSRTYGVSVDNLKKWNNLSDDNIKVGQVLQLSDTPAPEGAATQAAPADTSIPRSEEVKPETKPAVATTQEAAVPEVKAKDTLKVLSSETTSLANGGGAFASQFGQDVDNLNLGIMTGKAKTFKSQSGWSDQKFYIMMNDVTPGGIVKVTYNGVSIFAKVLWNLIDTKENSGLSFRLSDAAASALGVTGDGSFDLKVDYYK